MSKPYGFSWVQEPLLAGLGRPSSIDELAWLRENGIEVLVTLTEEPLRRVWVNEAGLMTYHEPILDMTAPTQAQIDRCISFIEGAHKQNMGVAVHCAAGKGRTGTILACCLIAQGEDAKSAIEKIRQMRPGSIETSEQEEVVEEFGQRRSANQ